MTAQEVKERIALEQLRLERRRVELEIQRERNKNGANMQAVLIAELAAKGVFNYGQMPTQAAPQQTVVPEEPEQSTEPDDFTDEDREFFSEDFRSIKEVADYLGRSKTYVREELIDTEILEAEQNPRNGYYRVSTHSVKGYLFRGQTSKEKRQVRSTA